MEKDLKAQNNCSLTAIYVCALFVAFATHWGVAEVFELSVQLGEQALIAAAITACSGLLSNVLPNRLKHPLVYWRFRNVLSGHRCRTICEKDPRLIISDLQRKWPEIFVLKMEESEQNAYWYRHIYRGVRNEPEVLQAHRSFLLYRDVAAGLILLLVSLVFWNVVGPVFSVQPISLFSVAVLAISIVVASLAARQSGDRMVANSVAVALRDFESVEEID